MFLKYLRYLNEINSTETEHVTGVLNSERFSENEDLTNHPPYFAVVVRSHIPTDKINRDINLPPKIKRLEITTNEKTIEKYSFNHIKGNNFAVDQERVSLCQLL
jgi:hypothetical protein